MSQPSEKDIAFGTRFAYGLLALPIAVAGLPVYLQMPQFYAEMTGLSLGALGMILFLVRFIDTVQDPIIGSLSDRGNARGMPRVRQMRLALPFFVMGFFALVMPTPEIAAVWLAVSLIILYTSFSFLTVNYYALGTSLVQGEAAQTRLSTWREGMVLVGILLGSVVPQIMVNAYGKAYGYMIFAMVLGGLALVMMPRVLRRLEPQLAEEDTTNMQAASPWKAMKDSWHESRLRALFGAYLANGLANAFPATLILFYVSDVLGAEDQAGYLLGAYFAAGILCMPLWAWVATRIGAAQAWVLSMVIAGVVFFPSAMLGEGDVAAFYVICVLSGACLGADMAMPPSILSHILKGRSAEAGGFFGIYNLLFKLGLALAAGIGLPLLASLGYAPETEGSEGLQALAWLYGGIPAFLKLSTAIVTWMLLIKPKAQ